MDTFAMSESYRSFDGVNRRWVTCETSRRCYYSDFRAHVVHHSLDDGRIDRLHEKSEFYFGFTLELLDSLGRFHPFGYANQSCVVDVYDLSRLHAVRAHLTKHDDVRMQPILRLDDTHAL